MFVLSRSKLNDAHAVIYKKDLEIRHKSVYLKFCANAKLGVPERNTPDEICASAMEKDSDLLNAYKFPFSIDSVTQKF